MAFVGDAVVGEIAAGIEERQPGLGNGSVDDGIGGPDARPGAPEDPSAV
jgi:hypothetical protein